MKQWFHYTLLLTTAEPILIRDQIGCVDGSVPHRHHRYLHTSINIHLHLARAGLTYLGRVYIVLLGPLKK